MKIAFYSTKQYDQEYFDLANETCNHSIRYFSAQFNEHSVSLIIDEKVVCVFVSDKHDSTMLGLLKQKCIELVVLRCVGYNNVDMKCAKRLNLPIFRVPMYSPFSVAEHAVGLLLCLNRGIHKAYNRVREGDFLLRNLIGFDLNNKTFGVIGTGRIGEVFAQIMLGFGCRVIAYDPIHKLSSIRSKIEYFHFGELLTQVDRLSLHCPLTPNTLYVINEEALEKTRPSVTLINTSRGKLIDSRALKTEKLGRVGQDVYEIEQDMLFKDLSDKGIPDEIFARITTFPNVIITSNQGFFTQEAMSNIAKTTLSNINHFELNGELQNIPL